MATQAGYSGKPLLQKLGIKPGMKIVFVNPPANYADLLGPLPDGVLVTPALDGPLDFIHAFVTSSFELADDFPLFKAALAFDGMLWISWPKKASALKTDLNDHIVRETGLSNKLVDVKVCAVDHDWSGLKFVYRVENRPQNGNRF